MTRITLCAGVLAVSGLLSGPLGAQKKESVSMSLTIQSTAFQSMQLIPAKYTCDGADISPPLSWQGVPREAKSLVLISDDPDAPVGTWVHWVCYDIPPTVASLQENMPKTDTLPGGGKQGMTDFRQIGYGGPCPPSGTHRYFFRIYALDTMLNLPAGRTRKQVDQAMQGHILAQGELVGKYARRR